MHGGQQRYHSRQLAAATSAVVANAASSGASQQHRHALQAHASGTAASKSNGHSHSHHNHSHQSHNHNHSHNSNQTHINASTNHSNSNNNHSVGNYHKGNVPLISHNNSDQMTTSSSDQTINNDDVHAARRQNARNKQQQQQFNVAIERRSSNSGSRFLLGILYTLAELLLFGVVLLWIYWATTHDDGFGWQADRKQQFNTHAGLMLLGFVFFNCQAMLVYRSFQCCSKIYTKILHAVLFVLATSAISLGLVIGFTAQENIGIGSKPIMHFYSLHAWIGLTTVALFVLQFVFGFISFLVLLCCDSATYNFRAALLPIHKTFGLIIFSLAASTALTGLLQTARSRLSSKLNKSDYHELAESGIVINLIGVCLVCLAIIIPFIIRNLDIDKFASNSRAMSKAELINRRLKLSQLDMRL